MSIAKYAIDSPHTKAWTQSIGKLILNFSCVEFETYQWFVQLSEDLKATQALTDKPFGKRVKCVQAYLERRSCDGNWLKSAKQKWKTAIEIASVRNQIAHNPIVFAWASEPGIGTPDFIGVAQIKKSGSASSRKFLSKIDIEAVTNSTANLVTELASLRAQWCAKRDAGEVPALAKNKRSNSAPPPKSPRAKGRSLKRRAS